MIKDQILSIIIVILNVVFLLELVEHFNIIKKLILLKDKSAKFLKLTISSKNSGGVSEKDFFQFSLSSLVISGQILLSFFFIILTLFLLSVVFGFLFFKDPLGILDIFIKIEYQIIIILFGATYIFLRNKFFIKQ